jgi:hypothetical protein
MKKATMEIEDIVFLQGSSLLHSYENYKSQNENLQVSHAQLTLLDDGDPFMPQKKYICSNL